MTLPYFIHDVGIHFRQNTGSFPAIWGRSVKKKTKPGIYYIHSGFELVKAIKVWTNWLCVVHWAMSNIICLQLQVCGFIRFGCFLFFYITTCLVYYIYCIPKKWYTSPILFMADHVNSLCFPATIHWKLNVHWMTTLVIGPFVINKRKKVKHYFWDRGINSEKI